MDMLNRTRDIAEHFRKIVELQKKTDVFMAFIPWSFEPNNTQMQKEGVINFSAGGVQLLKMIAISRLVFDGLDPTYSIVMANKWNWNGSIGITVWC